MSWIILEDMGTRFPKRASYSKSFLWMVEGAEKRVINIEEPMLPWIHILNVFAIQPMELCKLIEWNTADEKFEIEPKKNRLMMFRVIITNF